MTPTTVSLTTLTLVDQTSDKFYRVFTRGLDILNQYGRNGTYGSFTPAKPAADQAKAATAAAKVVAGKKAKGYQIVKVAETTFGHIPTEDELDRWATLAVSGPIDGVTVPQDREQSAQATVANQADIDPTVLPRVIAALDASKPRVTTTQQPGTPMPMLAHNAEPSNLDYMLTSPTWATQPKLDGDRVTVEVIDGKVQAFGRGGQAKAKNVGAAMLAAFRNLTEGRWVFDGEVVGRTFWVFDMPFAEGFVVEESDFQTRYAALVTLLGALQADEALIGLVPIARTAEEKTAMLAAAETDHKEGIMFRSVLSPYATGRSTSLLKHKFVKTIDAHVVETGRGGKQTAVLAVYDHDGNEVRVGNVTTIGKGGPDGVKVGQVVEVRFLYITNPAAPVLYQPTILKVRTDKAPAECSTDQLIGAHTNRAV